MVRACDFTRSAAGTPDPDSRNAIRSVESYRKTPCVYSPCSDRLSPWSDKTAIRVFRAGDFLATAANRGPNSWSV